MQGSSSADCGAGIERAQAEIPLRSSAHRKDAPTTSSCRNMSQKWIVVDLDERACLHGGGKLGEWFWSNPASILDALRVPHTHDRIDNLLAGRTAVQHAPLFRIPFDLIDDIFVHITITSGAQDSRLLLLALTCKTLLAGARRHIVRLQTRQHAPLAGHRLICIGDRARTPEDYPAGLLTTGEVNMVQESTARLQSSSSRGSESESDYSDGHTTGGTTSLYAHAIARWWRYSYRRPCILGCVGLGATSTSAGIVGSAALMDLLYRPSAVSRMSKGDFALFQTLTAPYGMESASTTVLCNLSKNEYVRAEACARVELGDRDGKPALAETGSGTLWHILLACICWSPSNITNMGYEGGVGLHSGRWAGDRFAITTLESMVQLEDGAVWTEITLEVTQLVEDLWANTIGLVHEVSRVTTNVEH
ncbi:hypothetical protein C8Q74DRAFT_89717 [Fomes fomentarius]|nr:hypothetical protein C8Q74DRAFT_89717 [Fomes fomentarius]